MLRTNLSRPVICIFSLLLATSAVAATPTVEVALKLTPMQRDVDYDTPRSAEISQCSIKAEKVNGMTAWVVRGPDNEVLRQFADSDADNVVDIWSYFRDGLEVYRDIDSNKNGKADQFRWFHSDGTRWGLDPNEDNVIDTWKLISPEEVAEEVVNSLANNEAQRFERLLLSKEDIKKLGLDAARTEQIEKRIGDAAQLFEQTAENKELQGEFAFSDFGGVKPGIVPAGSQGVTKDLMVYENVWAMVRIDGTHRQLHLGTMISLGGSWKLIDGPILGTSQEIAGGFFYDSGGGGIGERAMVDAGPVGAPTEKMQTILDNIEDVDEQLSAAEAARKPELNEKRANLLLELANAETDPNQRAEWLKQLADSVSAATQEGSFPRGVAYLKKIEGQLAKDGEDDQLIAYFEFHRMAAEYYGLILPQPEVDIAKAQEKWLSDLEAYVDAHPKSELGAEALRALAVGYEMAGENDKAVARYRQIVQDYPKNMTAELAKGAVRRLTSEGKEIKFVGTDLNGNEVDLKALRGKAVVIQYWTTSSDVCKADHAVLKELIQKYGGKALEVISVCLDFNREPVIRYLKENRLPWRHLYDPQGFDGPLANEMGVVTVPLTIMVGPDGKVISNNIQVAEIESELKKL